MIKIQFEFPSKTLNKLKKKPIENFDSLSISIHAIVAQLCLKQKSQKNYKYIINI